MWKGVRPERTSTCLWRVVSGELRCCHVASVFDTFDYSVMTLAGHNLCQAEVPPPHHRESASDDDLPYYCSSFMIDDRTRRPQFPIRPRGPPPPRDVPISSKRNPTTDVRVTDSHKSLWTIGIEVSRLKVGWALSCTTHCFNVYSDKQCAFRMRRNRYMRSRTYDSSRCSFRLLGVPSHRQLSLSINIKSSATSLDLETYNITSSSVL